MSEIIHDFDKGVEKRGTDVKKYDPSLYLGDVLPFWIVDTDFPSPVEVTETLGERAEMNHYGYPHTDPAFEESIARWYKVRHSTALNPEHINFSPCVIPAIIWFAEEFSSVGDKILLQTPVYPPFHDLVKSNGHQLVYNEMDLVNGRYEVNLEDSEEKLLNPKARILFIRNPQNPTGRRFTRERLVRMREMCIRNHVMVGVDEIHGDIIFDGHTFIPFYGISEEFVDHSVTFINPAKTFNVTGSRTAARFTHNKEICRRMTNQQTYKKGMERNIFGNAALTACYNHGDDHADQYAVYLNKAKNQAVAYIDENIPKIKAIEPEATFMIWMDRRGLGFQSRKELKDFMFKDAKVPSNDGTTFGEKEGKGFMRFNFAASGAIVMEGLKWVKEAVDRP